jgi:hypothetical protein
VHAQVAELLQELVTARSLAAAQQASAEAMLEAKDEEVGELLPASPTAVALAAPEGEALLHPALPCPALQVLQLVRKLALTQEELAGVRQQLHAATSAAAHAG